MSIKRNLPGLLPVGVQKRERTVAIADDHPVAASVITNVVGICGKLDRVHMRKGSGVKHLGTAIFGAGNEQAVCRRIVVYPLRLGQICDRPEALAGLYVEYLDRV